MSIIPLNCDPFFQPSAFGGMLNNGALVLPSQFYGPQGFMAAMPQQEVDRDMKRLNRLLKKDMRKMDRMLHSHGLANLGKSEIKDSKEALEIDLDVSHFKPEELTVRVENDQLIVDGSHDEIRAEDGSHIARRFTRKYQLPKDVDLSKLTSTLVNGTLELHAPKLAICGAEETKIPIKLAPNPREAILGK